MLPSLIRFSRSGLIQYLTLSDSSGGADDQGDLRAVTIAVERGLGRGVSRTNHRHLLAHVRVRLTVVVGHLRQILAGYVQKVGLVEEAGRDDDVSRRIFAACRCER